MDIQICCDMTFQLRRGCFEDNLQSQVGKYIKIKGGSLYHDDMIKKGPPENFAHVISPTEFFLAFLLNTIIPRKSPPEEESALKNAPLKYAWRSQCPPEIEKAK